jgi:hypothetical protein
MANTTESPFSVTFKSPKGGTLITVRGDTQEELGAHMAGLSLPIDPEGGTVLDMIKAIDAALTDSPPFNGGQVAPQGGGGQQAQQSLLPACPDCGSPTVEKTGNGQRGPWRGAFCTSGAKGHKVTWL